ncbi:hypothetical protein K8R61_00265 [bacterium]|nr:hypothetical protein [bacterium]
MDKNIKITYWLLIINFLFLLSVFFIPVIGNLFKGSILFLIPFITFCLLGFVLTILTAKSEIKGKLRKFLLLTGVSSAGMLVSILLHNFIYGLFIFLFGENVWGPSGAGDEPVFFIIAIIICPIGFLIGAIGSGILFIKKTRTEIEK